MGEGRELTNSEPKDTDRNGELNKYFNTMLTVSPGCCQCSESGD